MSGLRRAWKDLGGAGFLSAPVLLAYFGWTLLTTLYFEVVGSQGPLIPWLTASLTSSVIVVGLLAVIGGVLRAHRPQGPGPVAAVTIFVVVGALRGTLLWWLGDAWHLATSVGPASRVAQSAVWAVGVLGCAGIVMTRRIDHRRLMLALDRRQRELRALQSSLAERIEQTHRELVEQVSGALDPTLIRLRSSLDALSRSSDDRVTTTIEDFRSAVQDVVRPLSRSLATEDKTSRPPSPAGGDVPVRRAPERLPLQDAIAPGPSAALVLALLTLLAFGLAPEGYRTGAVPLRLLVLASTLWLALYVAQRVARRGSWMPTSRALVASLALLYLLIAWVVGTATREITSSLDAPTTTFPALAFALTLLTPLVVTLALVLQRLARRAEVRGAETVAELDVLTAVLRRELWRERRRLALTVHGPIQSALVAAAVTLARPDFTVEQVPALVESLEQAMGHIERAAGPQPPIESAARDLATLWTDSAHFAFTADTSALDVIDRDEALRAVVIEILREGVSNAVRHGAAEAIAARINRSARDVLQVAIEDDGDGPPLSATPGLGSSMLDEVALEWSLTRQGSSTLLRVDLALESADGNARLAITAERDR